MRLFYHILGVLIIGLISYQAIPQTVISTIALGPEVGNGRGPVSIGINPPTHLIYIVNSITRNVSVIDGSTNEVVKTVGVGDSPIGVGVNPSTNLIYVANHDSNNVSVIDGLTNEVIKTVGVGSGPSGIGVNPTTNLIYDFVEKPLFYKIDKIPIQ